MREEKIDKKIVFLGGGNMGSAIISRMVERWKNPADIHVMDKNPSKLNALEIEHGVTTHRYPDSWLSDADCIVLAVKPQQLPDLLEEIKPFLKGNLILSIAAGVRTSDIGKLIGYERICRVMPNTPVKDGLGVLGVYMVHPTVDDHDLVRQLLLSTGLFVWCEKESMIDSLTAVSGSGPAYVYLFLEALENAALKFGFPPETARKMACYTVFGAADLAMNSEEPFSSLCKKVQSKGGTTIEATKIIEGSAFREMMFNAMEACRNRAVELADEFSESVKKRQRE